MAKARKKRNSERVQLKNGCNRSAFSVHPQNWEQPGADISKDWYIHYRFYDPAYAAHPVYGNDAKGNLKGKLCPIKGMNSFKTVSERRDAVKTLIADESKQIDLLGWNPISRKLMREELPVIEYYMISSETACTVALQKALSIHKCEPHTKEDIKSVLKYFTKSAMVLQLDTIPIGDLKRAHVRLILDNIKNLPAEVDENGKVRQKKWSANQFNTYRKYLSALYRDLMELEAVENNIIKGIIKETIVQKVRKAMSKEERVSVHDHLRANNYDFWRFKEIFFHSGARTTELMRLQAKNVNLEEREFIVLIKKGNAYREVAKPIPLNAYSLWCEIMVLVQDPEDFVFSKGLVPGAEMINARQVTRRWKRHVKDKDVTEADFYSIKQTATEKNAERAGLAFAAGMNDHSTDMASKHYAPLHMKHLKDQVKKSAGNSFI